MGSDWTFLGRFDNVFIFDLGLFLNTNVCGEKHGKAKQQENVEIPPEVFCCVVLLFHYLANSLCPLSVKK